MLGEVGGLLGWGILVFYGLALINFLFKIINKHLMGQLKKYPQVKKVYQQLMKFVIKNHHIFGSIAVVLIFFHLGIQWYTKGLLLTGVITAVLILTEVVGGIVGAAKKWKTNKVWLGFHRMVGILIGFAVLIHLIVK